MKSDLLTGLLILFAGVGVVGFGAFIWDLTLRKLAARRKMLQELPKPRKEYKSPPKLISVDLCPERGTPPSEKERKQ